MTTTKDPGLISPRLYIVLLRRCAIAAACASDRVLLAAKPPLRICHSDTSGRPVTNQVTTPPGSGRRSATELDTGIHLACDHQT